MTWLLACAAPWTVESAVAPHRDRLDADHDGRVTAAEYRPHAWQSPPFGSADADWDGDLSTGELHVLVRTQSPTAFDGLDALPMQRVGSSSVWMPPGERRVWEVLVAMADEVRAVGGTAPSAESVAAAVHSGSLESPEAAAVLAELRPVWIAQGWTWPL